MSFTATEIQQMIANWHAEMNSQIAKEHQEIWDAIEFAQTPTQALIESFSKMRENF